MMAVVKEANHGSPFCYPTCDFSWRFLDEVVCFDNAEKRSPTGCLGCYLVIITNRNGPVLYHCTMAISRLSSWHEPQVMKRHKVFQKVQFYQALKNYR